MAASTYRPYTVRVSAREQLSPHFVRVTFTADALAGLGWDGPDQRIKLVFPPAGRDAVALSGDEDWYAAWRGMPDETRPPMRTYTTRYADPGSRRLLVDFVSHGDTGPATRWVNRAAVGDEIVVIAPDASCGDAGGYEWHPGRATSFLIAADESAVPAAAAILESLPSSAVGAAFLEVPTGADQLELASPAGVEVTWLARDSRSAVAHGELLDRAVRVRAESWRSSGATPAALEEPGGDDILWEVPAPPADEGLYAWLAGEAGVITGLRRHLVRELGIDRSRVAFMGYWKAGRAESS